MVRRRLAWITASLAVAACGGLVMLGCGGGGGGGGASFHISSVSPPGGNANSNVQITVTGSLFEDAAAQVWVGATYDEPTFPAGMTQCINYGTRNTTTIVCETPNTFGAGALDVVVYNPTDDVEALKAGGFTFVAAPTFTSMVPTQGSTAGGQLVTITGTNFTSVGGGLAVYFDYGGAGQAQATSVNVAPPTTITCTTPAHAAGACNIHIQNGDYGTVTTGAVYTYLDKMIGSGGPEATWADDGTDGSSTTVYIDGSAWGASYDVDGAETVTIGGIPVTPDDINPADDRIELTVPPLPEGFHDIVVDNAGWADAMPLTDAVFVHNPNFTVYVSDAGSDAVGVGFGTEAAPYRSITRGLAHAGIGPGWTVLCVNELSSPASFSATDGETVPIALVSGVRVQGLGAASTAIVGSSASVPLILSTDNEPGTELGGFIVQSHTNTSGSNPGGGLYVSGGHLAVTNCTFSANRVTASSRAGGAMVVGIGARVTVEDCIFDQNRAERGNGGAIAVAMAGTCIITSSDFTSNDGDWYGEGKGGGAIHVEGPGSVLRADDCYFYNNTGTFGGAFYTFPTGATIRFSRSVFYHNTSDGSGGAVAAICDDMQIQSCLFDDNATLNTSDSWGGAVLLFDTGNDMAGDPGVGLTNCTFVNNDSNDGVNVGGDAIGVLDDFPPANVSFPRFINLVIASNDLVGVAEDPAEQPVVTHQCDPYVDYCDFYGHSWFDYWDDASSAVFPLNGGVAESNPNQGNLFVDPTFVGTGTIYEKYRLQPASGCVNFGDPAILDPDGSRSDMGAFTNTGFAGPGGEGNARVLLVGLTNTDQVDTVRYHPLAGNVTNAGTAMRDAGLTILDAAQVDDFAAVLAATKLYVYPLDPVTGQLAATPLEEADGGDNPIAGKRCVSDGHRVYVSDTVSVLHYELDAVAGTPVLTSTASLGTDTPEEIVVVDGRVVGLARSTNKLVSLSVSAGTLAKDEEIALTATNYHDLAVVASRYVALRYDDATDESVAIYSVAADGTLALEDTWAGTGISDDMAVWQNKIILGRSSGANAVTSLVVAADGTVSAGTVYRIDPGPVLVADATTGGNGVKDVEVGDGIVFCWNATEQVIGVWTMDISTGDLVRAQTPAFPFDPTDGVNWTFLDITNTSGKGKDVMKYLGGGNLLLAGDNTADAKDLFVIQFDSAGEAQTEYVSDTNLTQPGFLLLTE